MARDDFGNAISKYDAECGKAQRDPSFGLNDLVGPFLCYRDSVIVAEARQGGKPVPAAPIRVVAAENDRVEVSLFQTTELQNAKLDLEVWVAGRRSETLITVAVDCAKEFDFTEAGLVARVAEFRRFTEGFASSRPPRKVQIQHDTPLRSFLDLIDQYNNLADFRNLNI